jgi:uncharacterized membrane protein YdjX (TVP38/TMEM64 family)
VTRALLFLALLVACMAAALLAPGPIWSALSGHAAAGAPGMLGLLSVVAIQAAVSASGILPASLTGAAAGAACGIGLGFGLAASGTMAGAILAFWLSRSLLRPRIGRYLARRTVAAQMARVLAADGWRSVCLLRLSPVMPFALTSYALGLTDLGWRDYLLGTLASLPALLGYVVLGHLTRSGFASATVSRGRIGIAAIGIVATLFLGLRLAAMVRRSRGAAQADEAPLAEKRA